MLDRRLSRVVGPNDCDHVEPAWLVEQVVTFQKMKRGAGQVALFLEGDGFGRTSRPPCLDFNEDDPPCVEGDQVDLTSTNAVTLGQDSIALTLQEPGGGPLALIAEKAGQEASDGVVHGLAQECPSTDVEMALDFSGLGTPGSGGASRSMGGTGAGPVDLEVVVGRGLLGLLSGLRREVATTFLECLAPRKEPTTDDDDSQSKGNATIHVVHPTVERP